MRRDLDPVCEEPRRFVKAAIRSGQESDFRKAFETLPDASLAHAGVTASGLFLAGTSAYLFLEGDSDPFKHLARDDSGGKWLNALERHSNLAITREKDEYRDILHFGAHDEAQSPPPYRSGFAFTIMPGCTEAFEDLILTLPDSFFNAGGITGFTGYIGGPDANEGILLIDSREPNTIDRLFDVPDAARKFDGLYALTDFDFTSPRRRLIVDVRDLKRAREHQAATAPRG